MRENTKPMRSDSVTKGAERAPMRSLFYAMGYTKEELERPLIGVVNAHSEIVPGHSHLDKITEAVKAGIRMAGGTPIEFPSIGVCDGIAMGHEGMKYSLPSRELIADSVESMAMGHMLDGLVLVPNCDKIVPGQLIGAIRVNLPTVVCSGGPMLAGLVEGEETSLSKMFEAVGARKAGLIDDEGLRAFEENVCPGCGSCAGMYTANSMNCLCEAIGIALPGNGTIPAVMSGRIRLAKQAGMKVMEMVEKDIRILDIIKNPGYVNPATRAPLRRQIEDEVFHIFDFSEFSARTVGQRWASFTPAQQKKFSDAFADLLLTTYLGKIDGYNGEKVTYTGERSNAAGNRVEVSSDITMKDGKKTPVSYRMMNKNGHWCVYDVLIEGVSLVKNYRTQFQDILTTASPDELTTRVKTKALEARNGNAAK